VFPSDRMSAFAILQSRVHEVWARFFGSSIKDDLRYSPSDCFETFPFPTGDNTALETAACEYYEFRAKLMFKNNEGLTKTYNRFHDRYETSSDIARLRALHNAMDRAVLGVYGWNDIDQSCEFIPTYQSDDTDDPDEVRTRYRWSDEVQDEVLGRLLALNAQHAQQEQRSGSAAEAHQKKKHSRRAKRVAPGQTSLQTGNEE
jgi:hypothetical protein